MLYKCSYNSLQIQAMSFVANSWQIEIKHLAVPYIVDDVFDGKPDSEGQFYDGQDVFDCFCYVELLASNLAVLQIVSNRVA